VVLGRGCWEADPLAQGMPLWKYYSQPFFFSPPGSRIEDFGLNLVSITPP